MTGRMWEGVTGFGDVFSKSEGMAVYYDGATIADWQWPTSGDVPTTYVERRVPLHLEAAAHEILDKFLVAAGYDLEQI